MTIRRLLFDVRMVTDLLEGFRAHAGRYALAAFSIAIGIMAFSLLLLIVSGLQSRIATVTAEFGADVVSIVREMPLTSVQPGLTMHHVEGIRANFPELNVAPLRLMTATAVSLRDPLTVIATGPELVRIRDWNILEGRNLDNIDIRAKARVLLASRYLSEVEGFRAGRIVIVGQQPFFVIGVVDAQSVPVSSQGGTGLSVTGERFVLIPWSTAPAWQGERDDIGRRMEQVLVRGSGDASALVSDLQRLFAQPGFEVGSVSWVTAQRLVADIERLQRTIMLSVGAIALLCLLLGGTTLMSLMVLNVRERLDEIGLRISLGARRSQISLLFVIEALLVTLLSGVVGTIAAHAMAGLIGERLPVTLESSWLSIAAPTAVAVVLGSIFSWWPARIAARVSPAEAIRSG